MYWVSSSEVESETRPESSAIVGSVSLEVDQGFDQRLVSLGFRCVAQQDGTPKNIHIITTRFVIQSSQPMVFEK